MFFKAPRKADHKTAEEWFESAKRRYQELGKSSFSDSRMPEYVRTLRTIVSELERAIEIKPDFVEAWFSKACIHWIMAQHPEYRSCFETILRLNPSHANTLFCMANLKWEDGETEEALALYRKVVAVNPEDAAAWYNLSESLILAGDVEEADEARDRAGALRPDLVDLSSLLDEEPRLRLFT